MEEHGDCCWFSSGGGVGGWLALLYIRFFLNITTYDEERHFHGKRYIFRLWQTTLRYTIFRRPAISTGATESEA